MDQELRHQLELEIAAIERGFTPPRPPACLDRAAVIAEDADEPRYEPFGAWLLAQRDRGDWIDQLADAARGDRYWPKRGNPAEVRAHLEARGITDPDTWEQLDDAEYHWVTL